jgi:nitrous oxidase accessory protein NosD
MKKVCLPLLACFAAFALTGAVALGAPKTTRHVSTSGTDTGTCITSPCRTIGYAIAQANAGDTVSVASGTYAESVAVTKRLSLVGNGATVDATGELNGILISGAGATVIQGFTIVNAQLEGIFANKTADLTIADNVLMENDAAGPFDPLCINETLHQADRC